jgi:hypothetical protein
MKKLVPDGNISSQMKILAPDDNISIPDDNILSQMITFSHR